MLESDIYEIKKALEQHDERLKNLEKMFEAKTKVMNKELSINEFIRRKRPKNNVEKTLVVAYFDCHTPSSRESRTCIAFIPDALP